jgi:predicted MPP superfamily phosphohydrolase
MSFALFIAIAAGLLLGITYFCYYSFASFFGITAPAARLVTLALFMFFSLSFIFASLLSHWRENIFTRSYYAASGFWLGLLVNLLMASLAGWIIIAIAGFIGHRAGSNIIGMLFFGVALIYSVYGVWNAFNPQVKEVSVTIKDLPPGWRGKTIVQLSDVHLGHIYKADFLGKVVKTVNALKPDMVVITGDLFDGMDGSLLSLVTPLNDLVAPDGVYFITGNHETYLGVGKAFSILEKTKVKILNDEVRDIRGLQLVGISYPLRGQKKSILNTIRNMPGFIPGKPTVLLYHAPVMIDEAREAGVNLQLSGHTHKGQIFPVNFITSAVYRGFDYGLYIMGDYSLYTTDGVGTWGPPMRTGNTPEIVDIKLH